MADKVEKVELLVRKSDDWGGYQTYVICPFCNKEHTHMRRDIYGDLGQSVAHCGNGNHNEYQFYLSTKPEQVELQKEYYKHIQERSKCFLIL